MLHTILIWLLTLTGIVNGPGTPGTPRTSGLSKTHRISETPGSSIPVPALDQGMISPSPNAASFATYGLIPVTLYSGIPSISLPVYTLKVGSLAMPITLDYDYNGFKPKEDASWTGLGWNLTAGGSITRIIQGQVDGSLNPGYNYGEYDLVDSALSTTWQQDAYDNSDYDEAPDLFVFNFPGHSGKFTYTQGIGYTFPYQKLKIFKASNDSYITITDENGTIYTFGSTEITTTKQVKPNDPHISPYVSSWFLTQVVSANQKDTISLGYAGGYTYKEFGAPYGQVDQQLQTGSQWSDNVSNQYDISPSISSRVLASISCNHSVINFTNSNARLDVSGNNYPELDTITISDRITGITLKKYAFTYGYFSNSHNPYNGYYRLKLKQFSEVGPGAGNTPEYHSHTFYYNHEYTADYPSKGTYGIDDFGYYNGRDDNTYLLPNMGAHRSGNFTYCSYAVLDSIVYPTGGSTGFAYESNDAGYTGPGIRVKSISSYSDGSGVPALVKRYTYSAGSLFFGDNSTSEYSYTNTYSTNGSISTDNYNIIYAGVGSAFGGSIDNTFYYSNVSEYTVSPTEQHRTDYAFDSYVGFWTGVNLVQKTDYRYDGPGNFTPISQQTSTLSIHNSPGKSFQMGSLTLTASNSIYPNPPETFASNVSTFNSAWLSTDQQQQVYFDAQGNTGTTTTNYYYNPTTINLQETSVNNSDGSYTVTKFKYPEDYTSAITGALINAHVLSPVIEQQLWQKNSSTDSVIIGGKIVAIDSTLFRPTDEYFLETTAPMHNLTNETQSGGLYTSLVSDVNYVDRVQRQYDNNANLIQQNLSSNAKESYIWAYAHSLPIAKVQNAPASQIAYTSFETGDQGNWSYSGASIAGGKTGDYSYNLSSGGLTSPSLPAGAYIVSYWTNGSPAVLSGGSTVTTNVNGQTDGTIWAYYEYTVSLSSPGTISLSGSSGVDEVRLYPAAAQMSTYTYRPSIGISSQCSPAGRISYYQYDGFNRLQVVLDQQKNITKTFQYNYVPHHTAN